MCQWKTRGVKNKILKMEIKEKGEKNKINNFSSVPVFYDLQ